MGPGLLLGTAATAAGAAATSGLFGAAGAFGIWQTMSTIGAVMGAAGALSSAASQRASLNFQSQVQQQQARRARAIGRLNARRIRMENARLAGLQRAQLAGTGADPSTGSALLLQSEFAEDAEFEALLARAGADTRAARLETQSTLSRFGGRAARRAGFFTAGTRLLKGFG